MNRTLLYAQVIPKATAYYMRHLIKNNNRAMGQNVYSSAVFAGGRPLYLERVVPINHSWHQKTRDTGLPKVKTASPSAFPRFDTIPECDGRTDGRTDGPTDLLQHIQRLLSDVSSIYLFFIQTLISE